MHAHRRKPLVVLAGALVVVLALTGCKAKADAEVQENADAKVDVSDVAPPTVTEVAAIAATLPSSQAQAVTVLVDDIFGSDRRASLAATAELLALSGIGLVSDDGELAVASDLVITDALMHLGDVPAMTDSLVQGQYFDGNAAVALFDTLGVAEDSLTPDVLADVVRRWGKDGGETSQARIAGDAARAIADHEGELPLDGASLRLDALSMYVLFAQSVGYAVATPAVSVTTTIPAPPAEAAAADRHGTAELVSFVRDGSLDAVQAPAESGLTGEEAHCVSELKRLEKTGEKLRDKAKKEVITKAATKGGEIVIGSGLTKGLNEEFILKYSKLAGKSFDAVSKSVGIAQNVATTLLLLTGVALKVTDDHDAKMHFRHRSGDISGNIDVTAKVTFDQSIVDQNQLACYKLIGVEIPTNGAVSGKDDKGKDTGWEIHWSFGENIAPNNYYGSIPHGDVIRPQNWDELAMHGDNQPLDENGEAVLDTMTRTEKRPEEGAEHTVSAEVVAKVDLVRPIKITPSELDMAVQLGVAVSEAVGFPSARHTVTVRYHGQDAYAMTGAGRLSFLVAEVDFNADYYSCNGLEGPWQGSSGYTVPESVMGYLGSLLGDKEPSTGTFTDSTTQFNLDPKVTEPQKVIVGTDGFGVQATLQNVPERGEHIDGYIGTATWLMPGNGTALDTLFARLSTGGLFSDGITYDIRGVPGDPRCPGATVEEDQWDD